MAKNKKQIAKRFFILFFTCLIFLATFFIFSRLALAAETAAVQATIKITVCGNNIKETGEQCDGTDLDGVSCASRGFNGGALSCKPSCEYDVSACTSISGGDNNGSGSFVYPPALVETTVVFSGRAYPKSAVTLLKDAQIVATTVAGADANFQISISGLAGGNYIFSVYSEDNKGVRSSFLTFPVSITSNVTTNISGVFVAPTIGVDKSEVKRGDIIAVFGQSAPQADIVVLVNSEEELFVKTIADKDGIYLYNFDTSLLEYGTHNTKSKASIGNQLVSSWSYLVNFDVGTKNVMAESSAKCSVKTDLNSDCHINLVDFSIMAYWYKRSSPPASVDINGDGKIDLTDFSIMAYYWTG